MFGINLCPPFIRSVILYLDELSDEARSIGAVNIVLSMKMAIIGYIIQMARDFLSACLLLQFQVKR